MFATNDPNKGLFRVSAAGGTATVLTTPDATRGEAGHLVPVGPTRRPSRAVHDQGAWWIEPAQVAVLDFTRATARL